MTPGLNLSLLSGACSPQQSQNLCPALSCALAELKWKLGWTLLIHLLKVLRVFVDISKDDFQEVLKTDKEKNREMDNPEDFSFVFENLDLNPKSFPEKTHKKDI